MKKHTLHILCGAILVLSLLLSACHSSTPSENSTPESSTAEETTTTTSAHSTKASEKEASVNETTTSHSSAATTKAPTTAATGASTAPKATTKKPAGGTTTQKTVATTTKKPLPSLTIYPVPEGLADNVKGSYHSVKVNGQDSFVYQSEVTVGAGYRSGFAEYTSFDFSGKVTVEVTAQYTVESVEILPSRDNIAFKQSGNTVTFTLTEPGQFFVKINGDHSNGNTAEHPLYIFANPPEENIPNKNDPNVVYFEEGVYPHQVYYLESNKTYYLAPGAFVYGRFYGENLENVTICGRGTLCGENLTSLGDDGRTICIKLAKNTTIDGIQVMHPSVWTVAFYQSRDIYVNNIKTLSHGMSSDGIDICASQDALVENCFFRGHDDILAVKAANFLTGWKNIPIPCSNVTFRNCVVWCDSSNPMTIGYETVGDVSNILYENIDVLSQSKQPVWKLEAIMAIEPHYGGTVDGVTYRDIRVDLALDAEPESLLRFVIDDGTGTIKNVRVEDVFINYGGAMKGTIAGSTRAPDVENIVFKNVRNSEGVKMTIDDLAINSLVRNVRFE